MLVGRRHALLYRWCHLLELDAACVAVQPSSQCIHIMGCVNCASEVSVPFLTTTRSPNLYVVFRLDAIGAVGIARCFTFGGRFNRTLYDPAVPPRSALTKEQYVTGAAKSTTINHFHEKLLKLKVWFAAFDSFFPAFDSLFKATTVVINI